MHTKNKAGSTASLKLNIPLPTKTVNLPIYNIRMMTDDEWNRLAYRNHLERQVRNNA